MQNSKIKMQNYADFIEHPRCRQSRAFSTKSEQSRDNSKFKIFLFLALVFAFGFWFFDSNYGKAQQTNFVPNELLIKLRNQEKIYKVTYQDNPDILKLQKIILENETIEYTEPNWLYKASYTPNDPKISEEWYLEKIKASQSWDLAGGGSAKTIVAVLDSGINIDHPDLIKNIWLNENEIIDDLDNDGNGYIDDLRGWDFVKSISDPRPKFDEPYNEGGIHHGTLISGIIAATGDNQEGTTGIAYQTKIMPLRVLNSQGQGNAQAVIEAVNYAKNNKAHIINLSFIGTNESYFLSQALKQAWQAGVIIVAAAGNETTQPAVDLDFSPVYPICFDKEEKENFILGVAAVDKNDFKTAFSNYGKNCVDITAPGVQFYGPLVYNSKIEKFNEYYGGYWSGTSVATAVVSGAAALVKSVNPLLSNSQIRDILLSKSDDINLLNPQFEGKLGRGRLNLYQAVDFAYTGLKTPPETTESEIKKYIVTGAGPGGGPHLKIFDPSGLAVGGFFAYDKNFKGGVNVATGDVDGDGQSEIITAPQKGAPHLRIFDFNGQLKNQFFIYDKDFRGGLNLASEDLDKDGTDEIIIGLGPGTWPYVYVYDWQGQEKFHFLAYSKTFRGGVNMATGDIDGDGYPEIITGAGPSGGPHLRIFDRFGQIKFHFFAYLQTFRGGVNMASGDLDGDGKKEIIATIASGASPYLRIFNQFSLLTLQFLAYDKNFYGGVKVILDDLDGDGRPEIITGPGFGGGPQIKIFSRQGSLLNQFMAYHPNFRGGASVAVIGKSQ